MKGTRWPALQQFATYGDCYHKHVCLCASFITSLMFSAIKPLATLLLMCVVRGLISSVSCGEGLRTALVSNQVTAWMWACTCVVLLTVLLTLSLKWLCSIYRYRGRQPGRRGVDEDTKMPERKLLCKKLADYQLLRPVHQRALRPVIYKHLVQFKL